MPSCPSCGAPIDASAKNAPCAACGALPAAGGAPRTPVPDLELDVPKRAAPKPAPRKKVEEEVTLELAVEPRAPVVSRGAHAPGMQPGQALILRGQSPLAGVGEVAFDARLLAEYGDPPGHWLRLPMYAWRVLKRRRELRRGLIGRREEAKRAGNEVEDALVAFAERVRPVAEKHAEFARSVEELRGAEDVLRSRDRVLASEQDAQTARLAAVDARLAKLEAELAQAQAEERTIAGELASAQAALARGESKLRRAESELRSAQQREADGSHG